MRITSCTHDVTETPMEQEDQLVEQEGAPVEQDDAPVEQMT
jgi:hypothetical protein